MTAVVQPEFNRVKVAPPLFAFTIFTSAMLVFIVEPMITKLVLPQLGGSAAVWNTAMVFFQAALLLGYGYAHLLQRVKSLRTQLIIHLVLLVAAAFTLPLHLTDFFGTGDSDRPIVWLLGVMAISIGAPFAVLSATAPLLQAWYARVRAGEPDAKNPYVLYAASNLGSFIALLAYPTLIEPLLTLKAQTLSWTVGYGLFFLLAATLAMFCWGTRSEPEAAPLERSAPIPWRNKIIWVLLAAAPSSLMLGVTQHLTTDVASAPFLWVLPLALYLLTFVLAFREKPLINFGQTLVMQAVFMSLCAWLLPFSTAYWALLFFVHLGTFFFTALMCHQGLAERRPPPDRLTEFYLLLSLGGMLGGVFNALIAPVIFDTVWEYPLVLVLALFARPRSSEKPTTLDWYFGLTAVVLAVAPPAAFAVLENNYKLLQIFSWDAATKAAYIFFAIAGVLAFLVRKQRMMMIVALTVLLICAHMIAGRYKQIAGDRSFFGVLRVTTLVDPRVGKQHMLLHGTTLHGAQIVDPVNRCVPMLYYALTTPLGQSMRKVQDAHPEGITAGVVGLGTGTMATFVRPQDNLTYFEIDPLVPQFARDPKLFTYIDKCAKGPIHFIMGDARLRLAEEPHGKYDYLLIDAFSSDAVPTHLLTVEALRIYLDALKPDGVVVLHLSNRNLEITQPAIAAAAALHAPAFHQTYSEDDNQPINVEASTEALLVAKGPAGAILFEVDPRWTKPGSTTVRPWTDDYTNLMGSLWRDLSSRWSYLFAKAPPREDEE